MNRLSWLMYLADLVGNVRGVLVAGLVVAVLAAGLMAFIGAMASDMKGDASIGHRAFRNARLAIGAAVIFGVLYLPIPMKSTVLMIAASEFGEEAAKSEKGAAMLGELEKAIRDQLRSLQTK